MLDRRSQILLKTLVERYIAEGEPVGSRSLSRYSGLDLSPATIRNIMADLEELGFIASPHTSAGRIPTARGYRLFVDALLTTKPLGQIEITRLESNLNPEEPQKLISSASQLLSHLTHFAGVVVAARRKNPAFRHLEFLSLSEKRVLLILVTPEGDVQNRILFADKAYTPAELATAASFLNQHYAGLTLDEIRRRLRSELTQLRENMSSLMTAALEASDRALTESAESYVVSGEMNLLDSQDLASNMSRLRELLELFERKTLLIKIMDLSTHA
ncbi:MAG: heat-inducible transcription repressor HrcA, partial [Betaproteobacteria bacterium]|nr:heat-inducible transcription repressor HrcA [Betaproteobacteria bacterium]